MTPVDGVAVVVPAHDEQDLVLACLDAVDLAVDVVTAAVPGLAVAVVVALDSCRDATGELVASQAPAVTTVAVERRAVGAARAAGTAAALRRLGLPARRVWTAHTDADSRVPVTWLLGMLAAAAHGADAVVGTVVPDDDLAPAVRRSWSALHLRGPDHPHVHGANLGVRASVLAGVGGWRDLATGEDVDLVTRLRAAGCAVRAVAGAPVVTSSRPRGRAPDGFAGYLRELGPVAPVLGVDPEGLAPTAG